MNKLKQARKTKGITQKQLGEIVGITQAGVAVHEKHGVKTVKIAKRYAAALGCQWQSIID